MSQFTSKDSQSNINNKPSFDFNYTIPCGIFTQQQRIDYEKNGYVLVKGLIQDDVLDKYKKRFQEICSSKETIPFMTVMKDITIAKSEFVEGEKAITKIQDFCYDEKLFEYCCLPQIIDHVKSVVGENVIAIHTMLINKPPGKLFFYIGHN
jgi:phytanoyl-CoA hydroxylase